MIVWATKKITELSEIARSDAKPVDRLRALDKQQVITEFLNILEDAVEEDNND